MRKTLTPKTIASLKPLGGGKRYDVMDTIVPHLGVRVGANGSLNFIVLARFPGNENPVRRKLGDAATVSLSVARETARDWLAKIACGIDPQNHDSVDMAAVSDIPVEIVRISVGPSFREVADMFMRRHVRKEGDTDELSAKNRKKETPLRSADEIQRILNRYVLCDFDGNPRWRDRPFNEIKRADVTALMDMIEDQNGAGQADHVLAHLSKLFSWYAARSDDYVSPIVRGMKRTSPRLRMRKRILNDEEIRALWTCALSAGTFGAFVRVALLTGQRRQKLLEMKWSDISLSGVWSIHTEAREKGNASALQLPRQVVDILDGLPRRDDNPYVFGGRFDRPFNGMSKAKAEMDTGMTAIIGSEVPHWVIHDLRRTAKSMMARARVPRDISERVLGHVIVGVEGVYDHYPYFDEKAEALRKLSALIGKIIAPDPPKRKPQARGNASVKTCRKPRGQSSSG